jgi:glucoamylase
MSSEVATQDETNAPGRPGSEARWTSSAKSGVGTALAPNSRVWFTLSHGILDEIYYPRVDQAATRDLGLIVTGGAEFFSEEKRQASHQVEYPVAGVPAYHLVNTCAQGRYRIEKDIVTDPLRDALLQKTRFVPLQGALTDYHLYALLAPHLANRGAGNTAWVGDYKGTPMLFAQRGDTALALACSAPWLGRSVGFVGVSDGWQDLMAHGQMRWHYPRAENGNVALIGEVDLMQARDGFVLALGFGRNADEAGHRALASLLDGFDAARSQYARGWQAWQQTLRTMPESSETPAQHDLYRISTALLRVHEAKRFRGGLIASLSIPWGETKGDDDLGGYHLVWPRDLVEAAGGLLAAGAKEDTRRVLDYLQVTQEADGHWPQNMWLDGRSYWDGIQMDETALPILLVGLARQEGVLQDGMTARFWPMVRRAAGFLVRNGPVTQQDRWEEDPGYSPFTLAVEIAALLVAADLADRNGEKRLGAYLRETADSWNDSIERWIYVTGTPLAARIGVEGYYVRDAPPDVAEAASPAAGYVPIKNRPPGDVQKPAAQIVSPDALALVRFGLRAADDPRIANTLKVIDALLKVETPSGPAWHRYNGDGYGEREDGAPFDGAGVGRAWPLLTGERGHYELAAGRPQEARRLQAALEAFTSEGGLLPEQIWDAPDVPEAELWFGRPSGSAMPLVWAHAEYVKLRRSLADGHVFDMPRQTVQRYLVERVKAAHVSWRYNEKTRAIPSGRTLRIELLEPALVHWSDDDWQTPQDTETSDTGLGVHVADIPVEHLAPGSSVCFTFRWSRTGQWAGTDFEVRVLGQEALGSARQPEEKEPPRAGKRVRT